MKTTTITTLYLGLILSFSSIYAQEEQSAVKTRTRSNHQNERTTETTTEIKQTTAQSAGERKGWDGTIKGFKRSVSIIKWNGSRVINFGGQGAIELDENDEISLVNSTTITNTATARTAPLKGIIVKEGKNPQGNVVKLAPNAEGSYDLPADWGAGNYKLEINMQADGGNIFIIDFTIDDAGNMKLLPTTNFRGKGSPKAAGF